MVGSTKPRVALMAALLIAILMLPVLPLHAQTTAGQSGGECKGYKYLVRGGDTWNNVANRTGVSVAALQQSNPNAAGRGNRWLYMGEILCIPDTSSGKPVDGYWYHVREGDTWNIVARKTGIDVRELWRANARLLDHNLWLYVGQRVWIPGPAALSPALNTPAAPGPTATLPAPVQVITATVIVTVVVTATPDATALPQLTDTPAATATAVPAPTATATGTATATATATPTALPAQTSQPAGHTATPAPTRAATATPAAARVTPTRLPVGACPVDLDGYPEAILARLNGSTISPDGLDGWLTACGVIADEVGGVFPVKLGPDEDDSLVVVLNQPADDPRMAQGVLLVYRSGQNGMMQVYRADGVAWVELVKAGDLNGDERADLLWVDRSCGAHTCFSTLHVDSWDADAETFEDWLTGEPEMAEPEIAVEEASAQGQGLEVVLKGGLIASAGAGPQRSRTEVYASPKGAEYRMISQSYEPSSCIYFAVLDANEKFNNWERDGFEQAVAAYRATVDDAQLTGCSQGGQIKDEVATLRDFARYRLIVSYVALGRASTAQPLLSQIKHRALHGAAETFLRSYRANTSIIQACRDVTKYAQATPDSWRFLMDWGYANPGFEATELCPIR